MKRRIVGIAVRALTIKPTDEVEADRLRGLRAVGLGPNEIYRAGRIDAQRNRVMSGAEVMSVALVPVGPYSHRNVLRKIVIERGEAVVDPGADGRVVAIEH